MRTISQHQGLLTSNGWRYWKVTLQKSVKVGVELEVEIPTNNSIERFQSMLIREFNPTMDIKMVGDHGVLDIKQDHSIAHGVEVVTVGRRVYLPSLHEDLSYIINTLLRKSCYTSHHCSVHLHILSSYFSRTLRDMERKMPVVILKNYYNLHNYFAPELFWIASAGDAPYNLTRYINFRRPTLHLDASSMTMNRIIAEMLNQYGRYTMVNLSNTQLADYEMEDSDIDIFHVELRYPDCVLSPGVITAWIALEYALLMKAVDLSKYGVVSYQDQLPEKEKVLYALANDGVGRRKSQSILSPEQFRWLAKSAYDMVQWLKQEIISLERGRVAYEALKKLAKEPVSLRRVKGHDWRKIERDVWRMERMDDKIRLLTKIIDLHQITGCKSMTEWRQRAGEVIGMSPASVARVMNKAYGHRHVWDQEIGTFIFIQ